MLPVRALPKSLRSWKPVVGTNSGASFLADTLRHFSWVLKAMAAFFPASQRPFHGEGIATPQATWLPITEAGGAAVRGQPPESASRFDPQAREQAESQAQLWALHCSCISKTPPVIGSCLPQKASSSQLKGWCAMLDCFFCCFQGPKGFPGAPGLPGDPGLMGERVSGICLGGLHGMWKERT